MEFYLPTKIVFGPGVLKHLPDEIISYGNCAFIVTGKTALRRIGLLPKIEKVLTEQNIPFILYENVHPEPDTLLVDRGLEIVMSELHSTKKQIVVVGIGGGSALDVAKAIAGLALVKDFTTTADYLDIDGSKKLTQPGLPFISVPTVAGTGAEVTMNAVLISSKTGNKRSLRSNYLFPKTAIIDPELTLTVPAELTAIAGIDCLIHLIEGYISTKATPISEMFAIEGMKLIKKSLEKAVKEGTNLHTRIDISLASLYGGITISNAGLGLMHGLGSVLGAMFKIPHGLSCGILLPEVLRYNLEVVDKNKLHVLESIFGKDVPNFMTNLLHKINLSHRLHNFGINKNIFPEIAEKTLLASSTKVNPREVTYNAVIDILNSLY